MWVRVWLAGACLAGLLTACAVIDPVDSRYDTIGRSLAKARNEAIFLNLVRASHDYPLNFVVVSNVTPSMTNTTNLGLPTFLFGPGNVSASANSLFTPGRDVIFGNSTASNATAISTNFSVSTQETSTFYLGFLKPIDLQTLAYFIRQGYPRELLFWLFTDSFEVTTPKGKFGYKYDPLTNDDCDAHDSKNRCFEDWVHIATLSGLTVEEKSVEKAGSAKSSDSKDSGSSSSKPQTTIYARFCNNEILAQQAKAIVEKTDPSSLAKLKTDLDVSLTEIFTVNACGRPWPMSKNEPQPDTFPLNFPARGVTFRIIPRSAYGVFEFLGTVMKLQRGDFAGKSTLSAPKLLSVTEDQNLINILQRSNDTKCFAHTWFYDGDYCVPEDAINTKRIFGLLAQLIAIQTAAADLSITPLVRIVQ